MEIKTYVINLERASERRNYILELLKLYSFLSVEVINAVEGNRLTKDEISYYFDEPLSYKRYGRNLNKGEIGCTLSHFKCYHSLLNSSEEFALILEDDITILRDLNTIQKITKEMSGEKPIILLLSGDYWYVREKEISNDYYISDVYDAVGSYAYLINRCAAELILKNNNKASCAADNWSLYKSQGVFIKAIRPYLIDANIEDFSSTINQQYFGENRRNMPLIYRFRAYWLAMIKKILVKQGKFVSKIRK